jgi:hypothetical protein
VIRSVCRARRISVSGFDAKNGIRRPLHMLDDRTATAAMSLSVMAWRFGHGRGADAYDLVCVRAVEVCLLSRLTKDEDDMIFA